MAYWDIRYYVLAHLPDIPAMIVGDIYGNVCIMLAGAQEAEPGIFRDALVISPGKDTLVLPVFSIDNMERITLATRRVNNRYELRCGYGKESHMWVTDGTLKVL